VVNAPLETAVPDHIAAFPDVPGPTDRTVIACWFGACGRPALRSTEPRLVLKRSQKSPVILRAVPFDVARDRSVDIAVAVDAFMAAPSASVFLDRDVAATQDTPIA
jgi:hypothetical protein